MKLECQGAEILYEFVSHVVEDTGWFWLGFPYIKSEWVVQVVLM